MENKINTFNAYKVVANRKQKRLTDADVRTAIANGADTAEKIAAALNISTSNAHYRLRQLNSRPAADVARLIPADAAKLNSVADVVFSDVNDSDYTPAIDQNYKTRDVDAIVQTWTKNGVNVLLIGDAGSGKTTLAQQLAARDGVPFLRVAMDDTALLREFIGKTQARDGSTYFRGGVLLTMLQKRCYILIDEFNALPPSKLFFLHELLDGRRFFVNDASGGKIINLHDGCVVMLACNPNNARYGGTNKMNAALIDRCAVVNVPRIDAATFADAFNCGSDELTQQLIKYYTEANEIIAAQNLRVVFSLRSIKRIAAALRAGVCLAQALSIGFYNCALLTAGENERNALAELARVVFGADKIGADTDGAKC